MPFCLLGDGLYCVVNVLRGCKEVFRAWRELAYCKLEEDQEVDVSSRMKEVVLDPSDVEYS